MPDSMRVFEPDNQDRSDPSPSLLVRDLLALRIWRLDLPGQSLLQRLDLLLQRIDRKERANDDAALLVEDVEGCERVDRVHDLDPDPRHHHALAEVLREPLDPRTGADDADV
eukprot:3070783-Rhodomonas_salina.2